MGLLRSFPEDSGAGAQPRTEFGGGDAGAWRQRVGGGSRGEDSSQPALWLATTVVVTAERGCGFCGGAGRRSADNVAASVREAPGTIRSRERSSSSGRTERIA